MSFSSGSDVHCRKALANFFQALERARRPLSARWLRIIDGKQSGNNNCTKIPDLSRLLGMDYEMYLPFMLQCGLVRMGRKNQPIVSIAKSKKNGSCKRRYETVEGDGPQYGGTKGACHPGSLV